MMKGRRMEKRLAGKGPLLREKREPFVEGDEKKFRFCQ